MVGTKDSSGEKSGGRSAGGAPAGYEPDLRERLGDAAVELADLLLSLGKEGNFTNKAAALDWYQHSPADALAAGVIRADAGQPDNTAPPLNTRRLSEVTRWSKSVIPKSLIGAYIRLWRAATDPDPEILADLKARITRLYQAVRAEEARRAAMAPWGARRGDATLRVVELQDQLLRSEQARYEACRERDQLRTVTLVLVNLTTHLQQQIDQRAVGAGRAAVVFVADAEGGVEQVGDSTETPSSSGVMEVADPSAGTIRGQELRFLLRIRAVPDLSAELARAQEQVRFARAEADRANTVAEALARQSTLLRDQLRFLAGEQFALPSSHADTGNPGRPVEAFTADRVDRWLDNSQNHLNQLSSEVDQTQDTLLMLNSGDADDADVEGDMVLLTEVTSEPAPAPETAVKRPVFRRRMKDATFRAVDRVTLLAAIELGFDGAPATSRDRLPHANPAAALAAYAELLSDRIRVSGLDDHDVLVMRHEMAHLTGVMVDSTAARDQFRSLLADDLCVLGPHHRDTLDHWTGVMGDPAAARDQLAALLPDQRRALGYVLTYTRRSLTFWTIEARYRRA
jgi:hypothetical protein